MHYVLSDIHNDNERLQKLLKVIEFSKHDHLYILGDLFDRSMHHPDPVGVYFSVLNLRERCSVVRGNHDQRLAEYIVKYYGTPERKRKKLPEYPYNTFTLLQERLTPVDIQSLAKTIMSWPIQIETEVAGQKYLLAHAATAAPIEKRPDDYFLEGIGVSDTFMQNGIEEYVSVCGHHMTGTHIWKNKKGNVYLCDCGCGYRDGKLACLCLDTTKEFYV